MDGLFFIVVRCLVFLLGYFRVIDDFTARCV